MVSSTYTWLMKQNGFCDLDNEIIEDQEQNHNMKRWYCFQTGLLISASTFWLQLQPVLLNICYLHLAFKNPDAI